MIDYDNYICIIDFSRYRSYYRITKRCAYFTNLIKHALSEELIIMITLEELKKHQNEQAYQFVILAISELSGDYLFKLFPERYDQGLRDHDIAIFRDYMADNADTCQYFISKLDDAELLELVRWCSEHSVDVLKANRS